MSFEQVEFDFSGDNGIVKDRVGGNFVDVSGYYNATIETCSYDARNNAVEFSAVTEEEQTIKNKLFLENKWKPQEIADGKRHFISMCRLSHIEKPKADDKGVFSDLIGKELIFGVQMKQNEDGKRFQNIQSVHSAKTQQTWAEILEGKTEPEVIKKEIRDWIVKPASSGGSAGHFEDNRPPEDKLPF